jgi:hypothetical protein
MTGHVPHRRPDVHRHAPRRVLLPPKHRLEEVGSDPLTRACHVLQRYTSAPSFWGIYRRSAVDQLSTIRYGAGFDHALIAELALYGEVRHVPELLYWRRDGGKPVMLLGRGATEQGNRGGPLDDLLGEQRWRTPLITTAYTHMEVFAAARLQQRKALMRAVREIFRARWLPLMQREAADVRAAMPALLEEIATAGSAEAAWMACSVTELLLGVQALLPECGFVDELLEIAAVSGTALAGAAAGAGSQA